jgi:hypothetical protein
MSMRRGRRRAPSTAGDPTTPPTETNPRYRIVIHLVSDDGERVLADHTVDGYILALGRNLPDHKFWHNTLRGGPLELTLNLASIIPDAIAEFIAKHLGAR